MTINQDIAVAVRRVLLVSAMAAAGAAMPSFGADAVSPRVTNTTEGDKLEEVVITGSRIAQPNLTSTSPIMQLTDA